MWKFASLTKLTRCNYVQIRENHFGFIGLGIMGGNMATHLIEKGLSLSVYDINKSATDKLVKKGAKLASSPAEIGGECDYVFTMLPSYPYILDAFTGKNGALSSPRKNTLFIDCSTIDPMSSKELHKLCTSKDLRFIDAPVAGALPAAIKGTLTFMCGGSKTDVDEASPFLLKMGKKVLHCGDIGAGEVAKICNNMMLAISMIGTSEALRLAQNHNVDPKMMTEILNISSGQTWVSTTYNPVPGIMPDSPASKNFQPGFKVELLAKDLGISQSIANKTTTLTPLGSIAHQIYKTMVNNGYSQKDFSSVYDYFLEKQEPSLKL